MLQVQPSLPWSPQYSHLCNPSSAPHPHPLSLPLSRTACPYFCSFVISPSPCLTTSAYCLFLSSGRFVSMILLTRSMVQGMRSAAMNFARSLRMRMMGLAMSLEMRGEKSGLDRESLLWVGGEGRLRMGVLVEEINRNAKVVRHAA